MVQNKKGLKNPFRVGKLAKINPDTINHFTNTHVSETFIQYSQTASDGGGDAPSWLLSKIMEAVFAILYIIFIKPLLWLLNKF